MHACTHRSTVQSCMHTGTGLRTEHLPSYLARRPNIHHPLLRFVRAAFRPLIAVDLPSGRPGCRRASKVRSVGSETYPGSRRLASVLVGARLECVEGPECDDAGVRGPDPSATLLDHAKHAREPVAQERDRPVGLNLRALPQERTVVVTTEVDE